MVQVPVHTLLLNTTKGDRHTSTSQANTHKERPYHKTISFVLAASFFEYDTIKGHTPTMFATTSTRPCMDRSFVMIALCKAGKVDEKPSNLEFLLLLAGSQQTQSGRTGQGSQRPTKQCAEDNASTAADRMWGIQWASPDTHFPDNLQKPLQAHADPHEATPQQYRNQQHLKFCPKL